LKNKKRVNLNVEELNKLYESYNQNKINLEISRLLDHLIQGKIFLNNETIQHIKNFATFFCDLEEIKQPIPLSQYQKFILMIAKAQPDLFQKEREYTQNNIFSILGNPMDFVK